MTRLQLRMMMQGLIATAIEKIAVLGWEDARQDVEKLIKTVEDLDAFWNSDGALSPTDWGQKIIAAVEKTRL